MRQATRTSSPVYSDFIPWADPYITSLVEKARRTHGGLLEKTSPRDTSRKGNFPPAAEVDLCDPWGHGEE